MSPARLAAAAALLLGAWDSLWYGVLFPTTAVAPPLGALLLAGPILLCIPNVGRGAPLALGCAGFLSIGYLAHGLTELVANPAERTAAGVATGLAALLMLLTIHALRVQRRAPRQD